MEGNLCYFFPLFFPVTASPSTASFFFSPLSPLPVNTFFLHHPARPRRHSPSFFFFPPRIPTHRSSPRRRRFFFLLPPFFPPFFFHWRLSDIPHGQNSNSFGIFFFLFFSLAGNCFAVTRVSDPPFFFFFFSFQSPLTRQIGFWPARRRRRHFFFFFFFFSLFVCPLTSPSDSSLSPFFGRNFMPQGMSPPPFPPPPLFPVQTLCDFFFFCFSLSFFPRPSPV